MAATITALTASALLVFAGPAFADSACNASFCITTDGSGGRVDQVLAKKVGKLQNVIGFFEARGAARDASHRPDDVGEPHLLHPKLVP